MISTQQTTTVWSWISTDNYKSMTCLCSFLPVCTDHSLHAYSYSNTEVLDGKWKIEDIWLWLISPNKTKSSCKTSAREEIKDREWFWITFNPLVKMSSEWLRNICWYGRCLNMRVMVMHFSMDRPQEAACCASEWKIYPST